jgi:hypothetical protein
MTLKKMKKLAKAKYEIAYVTEEPNKQCENAYAICEAFPEAVALLVECRNKMADFCDMPLNTYLREEAANTLAELVDKLEGQ